MRLVLNASYPCSSQFECSPITIVLSSGKYLLEVWGARGGFREYQSTQYGAGGYSHGILTIRETTIIFVSIGGAGEDMTYDGPSKGGFNGGGNCTASGSHAGGGGATDIRIGINDFHSRIIVAGGGGGLERSDIGSYGGAGGGIGGQNGKDSSYSDSYQGGGGSQTSGGIHHGAGTPSSFGVGGSASNKWAGGGGGGWYGGGAGSEGDHKDGQGGGGSGYVFTAQSKQFYPNPCLLSDSLFLSEAETITGTQQFLSPFGMNETGHHGNGFARITQLTFIFLSPPICKKSFLPHFASLLFILPYLLLSK